MELNSAVVWWGSRSSGSQGLGHAVLVWTHTQPQMWEGMAEGPHLLLVSPCRSLGPGLTIA